MQHLLVCMTISDLIYAWKKNALLLFTSSSLALLYLSIWQGPLLDFFSAKCNSGIEDGGAIEYCTSENTEEMVLPTPPPEAMASPYSYELQDSSSPQRDSALVEYQYIKGSSLEETPASSPSFSDGGDVEDSTVKEESNLDSVASTSDPQLSVKCESSSDEEEPAPLNVKMPQSKSP